MRKSDASLIGCACGIASGLLPHVTVIAALCIAFGIINAGFFLERLLEQLTRTDSSESPDSEKTAEIPK